MIRPPKQSTTSPCYRRSCILLFLYKYHERDFERRFLSRAKSFPFQEASSDERRAICFPSQGRASSQVIKFNGHLDRYRWIFAVCLHAAWSWAHRATVFKVHPDHGNERADHLISVGWSVASRLMVIFFPFIYHHSFFLLSLGVWNACHSNCSLFSSPERKSPASIGKLLYSAVKLFWQIRRKVTVYSKWSQFFSMRSNISLLCQHWPSISIFRWSWNRNEKSFYLKQPVYHANTPLDGLKNSINSHFLAYTRDTLKKLLQQNRSKLVFHEQLAK